MEYNEANYYGFDFSAYGKESFNDSDYSLMLAMRTFCKNRVQAPCYKENADIEHLLKKTIANINCVMEMMVVRMMADHVELN
jgi:hypothetical protein